MGFSLLSLVPFDALGLKDLKLFIAMNQKETEILDPKIEGATIQCRDPYCSMFSIVTPLARSFQKAVMMSPSKRSNFFKYNSLWAIFLKGNYNRHQPLQSATLQRYFTHQVQNRQMIGAKKL